MGSKLYITDLGMINTGKIIACVRQFWTYNHVSGEFESFSNYNVHKQIHNTPLVSAVMGGASCVATVKPEKHCTTEL